MKKAINLFLLLTLSIVSYAQTTWTIDPSHSKVNFSVSHLVISEVDGDFKTFDGAIKTTKDDFSGASISFTIEVSSINTGNESRDKHLQSEDFFHASKYPQMTFESTSFKKKSAGKYELKGKLTMRGVTKTVTFDVKHGGIAVDGYGNTRAGFIAKTTINRIDYGVAWNAKTEQGGWTVGEAVEIVLKSEFIKQK
ncbi:YceI family protein [Aureispira anguillae]|uniref:YceI family protein n=1 Tax=Aureispira anguillae TaxID=2864201 RepID=A0A915YHD5_9BACT|nr:YceI family protein [Aureispira anguillae]BDS13198.1 YceI family protein [Aureispira anguillae]